MEQHRNVDVVVVGGGAAGLSAAVTLGRARRSVLVIDDGHPRNAPAEGVHGFLTRDGLPPAELVRIGREEAAGYGVGFVDGRATGARRLPGDAPAFEVEIGGSDSVRARRVVVASGLVDELPDLPGLRAQWGNGVVHCPYCHGWEIRDRAIGVIAFNAMGAHQALLFHQWSADLTLFLHTVDALPADTEAQLAALGIEIVRGEVAAIESVDGTLTGVRLVDGRVVAREAVAIGAPAVASSAVLDALGVERVPHPMGADLGSAYPADGSGETTVPGVYAAGNVTNLSAQVVTSAAAGVWAAAQANMAMIVEDAAAAVRAQDGN